MKTGLAALSIMIVTFASSAFELDYNAICDDDNAYGAFSSGNNNYSINGYKRNDEETTIIIRNDPRKGKFKNEDNTDSGLKLEGVNKSDLEDLYYGTQLLK
ncbi:MAG: hypothetical protein ACI4UM_07680 [Succinivibrio sp.]